jgi:hypothetical protein
MGHLGEALQDLLIVQIYKMRRFSKAIWTFTSHVDVKNISHLWHLYKNRGLQGWMEVLDGGAKQRCWIGHLQRPLVHAWILQTWKVRCFLTFAFHADVKNHLISKVWKRIEASKVEWRC